MHAPLHKLERNLNLKSLKFCFMKWREADAGSMWQREQTISGHVSPSVQPFGAFTFFESFQTGKVHR